MEREEFREAVFTRDNHRCVNCNAPAQDAHHLIERSLWSDGGYHLDNGVSLCAECHLRAEATELSVEILRELAGITKVLIPSTLDHGREYDKWGNEILSDGRRMRGPVWERSMLAIRKIGYQDQIEFTSYYKYPRTMHLPWSPGASDDDIIMSERDFQNFYKGELIVTEKMDGENTTMYYDYIHARSLDSGYHASRTWVKNFWAENVAYQMPDTMRVVGENMYAKHSIRYANLPSYFLGFGVWEENRCYSWDDSVEWMEMMNITPVKVLARGSWNTDEIHNLVTNWKDNDEREGYVIRLAREFTASEFPKAVGKYVRKDHVTTESHWKHSEVDKNELA